MGLLLEAVDARIAVDGVTVIDRLTLSAEGERVLFAGDVAALFAALTNVPLRAHTAPFGDAPPTENALPGEAAVVAGTLRLLGRDVADGSHFGIAGAAPLDPPLPVKLTALEYVTWGARLGGASKGPARDLAATSLERSGISAVAGRSIGSLGLPERRVLVLAQALVLAPEVLVAEAPLSGLEGAAADFVLAAIARSTQGRSAVLSVARVDPGSVEGALARSATWVGVVAGGELLVGGPPAELFSGATHYRLTVRRNGPALRAELAARGIDVRGGPTRYATALPAGVSTKDVLAAVQATDAALVELLPILG